MEQCCDCGIEELKLSPAAECEIKRRQEYIEKADEKIKNRREAIDSINNELVRFQEEIIVRMAQVIDYNRMKKDREKEITEAYRVRDYNCEEISRIHEIERQKNRENHVEEKK
jgi:uncharacterized protein (DUF3084 family)